MTPIFSVTDYQNLHGLVFRPDYPGYKPTVKEIPNGDGKVDADKRFAHVATKYFATTAQRDALMPYLVRAHLAAVQAGQLVGLPAKWMPDLRYGALRILDYPPGSVSNKHEDFDLFTLMCYRSDPQYFKSDEVPVSDDLAAIRCLNPQAHLGQLGEAIGMGMATPHEVAAAPVRQLSIVYFAIPDHQSELGTGLTVRDWLNERMARSRTEFKKYE